MELKEFRFLDGSTSASASGVYLTDFRFNDIPERTLQGVLTSGAGINIFTYANRSDETVEHLVSTFTASSFSTVIQGPVAKIKVEKVGTTGTAWVEGLV